MTDLDDLIEQWHEGDSDQPLHEFLGMTWEQYSSYISTGNDPRVTTSPPNPIYRGVGIPSRETAA